MGAFEAAVGLAGKPTRSTDALVTLGAGVEARGALKRVAQGAGLELKGDSLAPGTRPGVADEFPEQGRVHGRMKEACAHHKNLRRALNVISIGHQGHCARDGEVAQDVIHI